MRFFLSCLRLQLKRALLALPKSIAGAALLSVLGGALAFSASRLLYRGREPFTAKVAVAGASGENEQLLLSFVSGMDSLSSFQFAPMAADAAYDAVKDGTACAALLLPDGLLDGILTGESRSVTLLLPASDALSSALLGELAASGAKLLCSAQAGIYAVHDLFCANGLFSELPAAYDDINRINLSYALRREALFDVRPVSAAGTLSVRGYYTLSAFLFLLLFFGATFGAFLTVSDSAFSLLLAAKPHGRLCLLSARFLSALFVYVPFSVLLIFLFFTRKISLLFTGELSAAELFAEEFSSLRSPASLLLLFCLLTALSAFALFCFSCTKTTSGGIFLLSLLGLLMLFLSGALLPPAFLPAALKTAGSLLFASVCFRALLSAASGTASFFSWLPLLLYAALFFLLSFLFSCQERSQKRTSRLFKGAPAFFRMRTFPPIPRMLRVFLLLEKRLFKKKGILLLLLALPAFLLIYEKQAETEDASFVPVALFLEEEPPFTQAVLEGLADSGLYRFYTVGSKEALLHEVETNRAECGFLFPADLPAKLDAGKVRGQIIRFDSPSTTLGSLINETVYAALFRPYSLHRLQAYLAAESALAPSCTKSLSEETRALYSFYVSEGVTFSFSVSALSSPLSSPVAEENGQTADTALSHRVFRGLLALYLLLVSLLAVFSFRQDKKDGSLAALLAGRRLFAETLSFFSYLFPALLLSLLSVELAGISLGALKELCILLPYAVLLFCFCRLLSLLLPGDAAFAGMVPLLLLGNLLFTPVFIDLSAYFPPLSVVQKLFPVYYYLAPYYALLFLP